MDCLIHSAQCIRITCPLTVNAVNTVSRELHVYTASSAHIVFRTHTNVLEILEYIARGICLNRNYQYLQMLDMKFSSEVKNQFSDNKMNTKIKREAETVK